MSINKRTRQLNSIGWEFKEEAKDISISWFGHSTNHNYLQVLVVVASESVLWIRFE